MILLPAARFMMGSDAATPEAGPCHEVKLNAFWIDEHEVTNAEFARFAEATSYRTSAELRGSSRVFDPGAP